MNRAMVLSAVAITVLCGAASAQSPATIQIGTASLHLGMSEQQVDAVLTPPFRVNKDPQGTFASWIVQVPDGNGQYSYVGSLAFRKGRLYNVRRNWGPSDQQAGVPLAKALYGAASQMVAEGRRQCVLSIGSRQDPRADSRTIFLECAGKRLEVMIVEGDQFGTSASIDEVFEDSTR
jgi:hypothetical protein